MFELLTLQLGPLPKLGLLALLRQCLQRWRQAPRHVYVCGANRFVEAVAGGLLDAGVPASVIRTERYGGA